MVQHQRRNAVFVRHIDRGLVAVFIDVIGSEKPLHRPLERDIDRHAAAVEIADLFTVGAEAHLNHRKLTCARDGIFLCVGQVAVVGGAYIDAQAEIGAAALLSDSRKRFVVKADRHIGQFDRQALGLRGGNLLHRISGQRHICDAALGAGKVDLSGLLVAVVGHQLVNVYVFHLHRAAGYRDVC